MIFVISMLDSTNTTSFGSSKKKCFFLWYLRGTPGTKTVKISFSRIKSKNMIRDLPWFKPDRNKWILKGAEKWPYPPSSFPTDSDWLKFPTDSDWMKKSLQVLLINDAMTQRKNCYFSSTIKATLIVTSESNALISNRQNFRVNEGTNRSVALRDVPS